MSKRRVPEDVVKSPQESVGSGSDLGAVKIDGWSFQWERDD